MHQIILIILIAGLAIWKVFVSSPQNAGKVGEKVVSWKLNWLSKEYVILNDIMLSTQYGTTQVDHIVVSPYGIFVIETKNYKGYIFGHENSKDWKQSLVGKRTIWGWTSKQHPFRNPILQNQAHCKAIQRLFPELENYQIIPIVVFSDNAVLNITATNHLVINWCRLRSTINQYNLPRISAEQVQNIVSRLRSANITGEKAREQHVASVQEIQQKQLERELKIKSRICPICNGELVERASQYGRFLGCSNYPKCKFTHKFGQR